MKMFLLFTWIVSTVFCSSIVVEVDNVDGNRISKSVICRIRIPKARANKEFVVFIELVFVCCWTD